jgi:hypothetical protein
LAILRFPVLHQVQDERAMSDVTAIPQSIITQTRDLVARRRRRRGLALAVMALPVLLLLAVTLDASAGLPAWSRLLLMLVTGLSSMGMIFLLLAWWRWLAPTPEQARGQAEVALGDQHRHLTAAMELAIMPGPLAAQATVQFTDSLDVNRLNSGLPWLPVRRVLLLALAAIVVAGVVHFLRPTIFPIVVPRLLDPFGDHPPWSLTALHFIDPPIRVRPPAAPRLVVQANGPAPRELVLVAEDSAGTEVARVVMLAIGSDQWSATLSPIDPVLVSTLHSPLLLWAEGAGTRTHRHAMALDAVPYLTGGTLIHHSPEYSRLPMQKHSLGATQPTITALPGSRLVIAATSNRPLKSITWWCDGKPRQNASGAEFIMEDPTPGAWSAVLEATDGIVSEPVPFFTVTRRIDQPPTIHFEQPQSDGVATPGMVVPMVITAEDDLGLVQLTRYQLRNGVRETEGRDTLGGTGDTWRGGLRTDGAKPGDTLRIGAVATDSFPPNGQVSTPTERTIHIISDADYNEMVMEQIDEHALEQKYSSLLERIAELETAMQQPPPADEKAEARAARLQKLAERAEKMSAEVVAWHRPEPLFAIEPELQQELEQHLAELEQAARDGKPQESPAEAAAFQRELTEMTAQAEADALREQLQDLAAAQRLAAQELEDLKSHGLHNDVDRARLREVSRQQQEMEQALKDWQEAAKLVQEGMPDKNSDEARELKQLASDVQASESDRLVAQAGRSGRSGRVGDAHTDAVDAANRLEKIAGKKKSGEGEGEGKGLGKCKGFGQCRSQLQGLAKRGFSQSSSKSSSGGGASGASGGGQIVRRGGTNPRSSQKMQLFGPEALKALNGGRAGNERQGKGQSGTAALQTDEAHRATAYGTGVRTTTAGVGAAFSPGEQILIEDYFRRLDGDPVAPVPAPTPATEKKP